MASVLPPDTGRLYAVPALVWPMDDPKIAHCTVELRPGAQHGSTQVGGLRGTHHFCFATFQRPDRLEWGALRGLNEYQLGPGAIRRPTFHAGFDIVTLVTAGSLRRLGTYAPRQLLTPGSIEVISTGRGVELGLEADGSEPADYIEIWIRTGPGLREPRRRCISPNATGGRPPGAGGSFPPGLLKLRADASIARTIASSGASVSLDLAENSLAYLHVECGALVANGLRAASGDSLAIAGAGHLDARAERETRLLLIRSSTRDGS